jgi:hypothetical protein
MARNMKLSRRPWLLLVLSIFTILVFVSVSCNAPVGAPVDVPVDVPEDAPVDVPADAPVDAPVATVEVQTRQEVPAVTVARDFYGPACESGEEEGAPYRWSVELLEDPATGKLEGTIKFHACPGGGRAVYRVSGATSNGTVYTLAGKKIDVGGGDLFGTAPEQESFTFDSSSGQITPNLAP